MRAPWPIILGWNEHWNQAATALPNLAAEMLLRSQHAPRPTTAPGILEAPPLGSQWAAGVTVAPLHAGRRSLATPRGGKKKASAEARDWVERRSPVPSAFSGASPRRRKRRPPLSRLTRLASPHARQDGGRGGLRRPRALPTAGGRRGGARPGARPGGRSGGPPRAAEGLRGDR